MTQHARAWLEQHTLSQSSRTPRYFRARKSYHDYSLAIDLLPP